MTRGRWAALAGVGALLAWAVLLALWPTARHPASRPRAVASTVAQPSTPTTSTAARDAGPAAVAERLVVVLDSLSWSQPTASPASVAGLATAAEARAIGAHPPRLTAAQIAARVTETAVVEAVSVQGRGAGGAAVWVDAVVTMTSGGFPSQSFAAPVIVEVVHAGASWLVDGVEAS